MTNLNLWSYFVFSLFPQLVSALWVGIILSHSQLISCCESDLWRLGRQLKGRWHLEMLQRSIFRTVTNYPFCQLTSAHWKAQGQNQPGVWFDRAIQTQKWVNLFPALTAHRLSLRVCVFSQQNLVYWHVKYHKGGL